MPRTVYIAWNEDMTEGVVFSDGNKIRAIQTGGRHGVHSDLGEFFFDQIGEDVVVDKVDLSDRLS